MFKTINIFRKPECNIEEKRLFIEAASKGDTDKIKDILDGKTVDVNTKTKVSNNEIFYISWFQSWE